MPAKNQHPFTIDGVLAYITDNRGIRYQCSQLSRVFKVTAGEMRQVLKVLYESGAINCSVIGRYRCFFLFTQEEIERSGHVKYVPEFKPLKGYAAMMNSAAQLALKGR
jgi:hypothetical protein